MEVYVDPRAEWQQMYREVWRIERDFFYDPGFHGLDLKAAERFYAPYLDGISTRSDLTYLFEEMLGNMTVGHMFIHGGTEPQVPKIKVGLLGADYKIENGRYRFAKVYNGENWNPQLQAPLTRPGVNVSGGEYLLGVRGRELHASDNIYRFFEETAGKQIVLKVGPNPDGHRLTRSDCGSGGQRKPAATPCVGGREPPQSGPIKRGQTRLCSSAGYGHGRVHQLQSLLLRTSRT
jgi:tricorn protease